MAYIKIKKLEHFDENLAIPAYETKDAAGADIRACFENKDTFIINPGKRVLIPTGLSFEIEPGYEVQVRPRSGLSLKTNLLVVNSPGTIDADYRGEVKIIMGNFGDDDIVINHGDRIAQIVLAPIVQANFELTDNLSSTQRGEGGFGSTGVS
ncbi:MAG: dUTP diphosphatase [Bacteriovoracaceae bacterium]|jgi:dUTP pyrophosphatase|nr:dUTP diphosphatase [Bacteriovoracaceae bacterium]